MEFSTFCSLTYLNLDDEDIRYDHERDFKKQAILKAVDLAVKGDANVSRLTVSVDTVHFNDNAYYADDIMEEQFKVESGVYRFKHKFVDKKELKANLKKINPVIMYRIEVK